MAKKKREPAMPEAARAFFVDAGKRGAKKRFAGLSKDERSQLNRKAALARWKKKSKQK
jgi:hypothetical protein